MAEDSGGGVVKRMRSDYFHEEIISEILARLPVKSILQFRCVCKTWRDLIGDSHFVKKQLSYAENGIGNNKNSRLLFLQNPPLSIDYEEVSYYLYLAVRMLHFPVELTSSRFEMKIVRVLGACNGLVCVEYEGVGIVLWNPSTEVSKVLPSPPTECHHLDFYGFGYDSTSDDYKVIRGRSSLDEETLVLVFSLKTGSWRTIQGPDDAVFQGKGWLFDGALHWLVQGSRIVSFSVAEEKFEDKVTLPDQFFHGVLVNKDHLCVYQIVDGTPGSLSVWLMEEYGSKESWTQVLHFSLKKLRREELRPLCIMQNGEALIHRILSDDIDWFDDPVEEDDPPEMDDDPEVGDDPATDVWFNQQDDDPDVFDDSEVDDDPYDEIDMYHQQLMEDDPDVFEVPDDLILDPYEEYERLWNQAMLEKESLLVSIYQNTSMPLFEVDLGFGAVIYKETLVSP